MLHRARRSGGWVCVCVSVCVSACKKPKNTCTSTHTHRTRRTHTQTRHCYVHIENMYMSANYLRGLRVGDVLIEERPFWLPQYLYLHSHSQATHSHSHLHTYHNHSLDWLPFISQFYFASAISHSDHEIIIGMIVIKYKNGHYAYIPHSQMMTLFPLQLFFLNLKVYCPFEGLAWSIELQNGLSCCYFCFFLAYLFLLTFPPGTTFMICLANALLPSHQIVLALNCFKEFPAGNKEKRKRWL